MATAGEDVLMTWEFLVPNLPVRDVRAAQRWYADVLGFGINWLWEDNFGSVGRDQVELFSRRTSPAPQSSVPLREEPCD
jgi:catechol 2,3-dioxygenase-like lactoylglutathione lyase family enzyme